MGLDALAGFISGSVISGSLTLVNGASNLHQDKKITKDTVNFIERRKEREAQGLQSGENNTYAISRDAKNKPFVIIEEDILAGVPKEAWNKTFKSAMKRKFANGIQIRNEHIEVTNKSVNEMTWSESAQWLRNNVPEMFGDKLRMAGEAEELLQASTDWVGEELKHIRKDDLYEFARGKVQVRIGENDYTADVLIGSKNNGGLKLYDIVNIIPTEIKEKNQGHHTGLSDAGLADRRVPLDFNNSISQTEQKNNPSAENTQKSFYDIEAPTAETVGNHTLPTAAELEVNRRAANAKTETERSGILHGVDDETIRFAEDMGKRTGRKVLFYEAETGEDGFYNRETGEVYVNTKSEKGTQWAIAHEVTHSLEGTKAYNSLLYRVVRKLRTEGTDMATEIQKIQKRYATHEVELSKEAAAVEVVANYVADNLMTDAAAISEMTRTDPETAGKIRSFLDSLAGTFGTKNTKERIFVEQTRKLYAQALNETRTAETAKTEPWAEAKTEDNFFDSLYREGDVRTAETAANTGKEMFATKAKDRKSVDSTIAETLRPEITENAELMQMLSDKFGADGTAALARQIKAEVERTGTVGRFGVLFSDGGRAVEEALGANDGGRQYSISKEESNSVREQVNTHLGELNAMESVASIKSAGRNGLSKDGFRKKIVESLRSTGFKVDRQGLGLIQFTEREINNSLNYMQTEAEFAAYQALPKVLKRGIEIGRHENHKGREYGTITIAAPIEINGERANMAVVVKQTKGNRYKVHRVLIPEGGTFKMPDIKNAEPTTGGGLALKDTHARPISSTSKKSITNGNEFVNTLDENIQYAITKGAEEVEASTESAETTENADFWDEWLEKVKEYGAMPKGEKPARDIEVPKKIAKNKPVSQTVRTFQGTTARALT